MILIVEPEDSQTGMSTLIKAAQELQTIGIKSRVLASRWKSQDEAARAQRGADGALRTSS